MGKFLRKIQIKIKVIFLRYSKPPLNSCHFATPAMKPVRKKINKEEIFPPRNENTGTNVSTANERQLLHPFVLLKTLGLLAIWNHHRSKNHFSLLKITLLSDSYFWFYYSRWEFRFFLRSLSFSRSISFSLCPKHIFSMLLFSASCSEVHSSPAFQHHFLDISFTNTHTFSLFSLSFFASSPLLKLSSFFPHHPPPLVSCFFSYFLFYFSYTPPSFIRSIFRSLSLSFSVLHPSSLFPPP